MSWTIGTNNFQNIKIRKGNRNYNSNLPYTNNAAYNQSVNNFIEDYIKDGEVYLHDFGSSNNNPFKIQNWYISKSAFKYPSNNPSDPFIIVNNDFLDGIVRLNYQKDSNTIVSFLSDAGYSFQFVAFKYGNSKETWIACQNLEGGNNLSNPYNFLKFPHWRNEDPAYPSSFGSGQFPSVPFVALQYYGKVFKPCEDLPYLAPDDNQLNPYRITQAPEKTIGQVQRWQYYNLYWKSPTHNHAFIGNLTASRLDNKNKWSTLVVHNNEALITWKNVYSNSPDSVYTRLNYQPNDSEVSRVNKNLCQNFKINDSLVNKTATPGVFATGIDGPYPDIEITSPGAQNLKIYLFFHDLSVNFNSLHFNGPLATASNITNAERALTFKNLDFNVYQKAVAVTRINSSSGQIIPQGLPINDFVSPIVTGSAYIFDKTSNRGDDLLSNWEMYVLNLTTGNWDVAQLGIDYDLGGGETLASDTINVTFNIETMFILRNTCSGSAGSLYNVDESTHLISVGAAEPLYPEIEWPEIVSEVTSSPLDTDPIDSLNPLTSGQPFTIRTEGKINVSTGTWTWIDPNPGGTSIVRVMSEQDWKDEINLRCNIYCLVKKDNILSTYRQGWGPHDIELQAGTYTIQFIANYKNNQVAVAANNQNQI